MFNSGWQDETFVLNGNQIRLVTKKILFLGQEVFVY